MRRLRFGDTFAEIVDTTGMRFALLALLVSVPTAAAAGDDWNDVPALVAARTAPIEAEVGRCSKLPKRITIIATRAKDGSTKVSMPMAHVGVRGFTPEERCLMSGIRKVKLPALPAEVERVVLARTIGGAEQVGAAWRDLPATIARVFGADRRAALATCAKPRTVRLVIDRETRIWLPAWQFHAASGDGSTPAPQRRIAACLRKVIRGWRPPALPAGMPELALALVIGG